ncbi:hypothetical protein CBM2633_P60001 [Cupriavidus taiwanensis]|uniref:Uncharacterized protein n=2 Tax=Cupriavidus TaxID=106589 RepID=A0A375CRX1_9BURK|nr:hypothetical protein CBM2588_P70001 [Cupriavidus taiwanensis]SOZ40751.1 hypothetical protein CBM2605_P60001 [Cupriavidus neocaledonicus]SOY76862.1 hypothetical protein CBM2592_P80001 [Cupriavidus taiwanensis]SOY76885.1 hypothetical protein CBM2585_P60001 [Cupriavidus taiwanensis]SOY77250.1 hypothetical protein CBM2589_P60001 [Cupriavidus taiwanensis]
MIIQGYPGNKGLPFCERSLHRFVVRKCARSLRGAIAKTVSELLAISDEEIGIIRKNQRLVSQLGRPATMRRTLFPKVGSLVPFLDIHSNWAPWQS